MSVSRPSRVKVAHIYSKRALRWRRNSSPYISGDAFADLCDYVYNPPKWRNFNRDVSISEAKSIFCKSHELQEMLDQHSDELTAAVIVCGNSDFEFHSLPARIPKTTKAFFLQNSIISDDEFVFSIPIGIENFRLGVNGNPKFIRNLATDGRTKRPILFGPLSPTHPVRDIVIQRFGQADPRWEFVSGRLSPKEYDELTRQFHMIAAVRGNGIDTHRLWESLYRGLTPIVAMDDWWKSLQKFFPQVVTINDWNVSAITEIPIPKTFQPSELSPLWMPFWEEKIRRYLDN
jgi:hypothetical protein